MSEINFGVLRENNALMLFLSQAVSAVCDKMMSIGLIWYLTKYISIGIIPWFLAITFLPHFIFSFFSSKLINFYGPLKIVISTDLFRGIVLVLFYFILAKIPLSNKEFLSYLFLSMFLVAIGSSLFNPAILTLPPLVTKTENIVKLNALMDSTLAISTIMGALFAIFLLQRFELKNVILINAISFLWAGCMQFGIKAHQPIAAETDSVEGPLFIIKNFPKISKMLFLFFVINFFLNPVFVIIPWFVEKIYNGNASSLALIEGLMGLGAFLTGFLLSIINIKLDEVSRMKMIALITFMFGIFFLLFSFTKLTWQGGSIMFMVGIISSFLNIEIISFFQTEISDKYIPTVMTAVNLISAASLPFTFIFLGIVFPYLNIPLFLKLSSLVVMFISFFTVPFLRMQNENK